LPRLRTAYVELDNGYSFVAEPFNLTTRTLFLRTKGELSFRQRVTVTFHGGSFRAEVVFVSSTPPGALIAFEDPDAAAGAIAAVIDDVDVLPSQHSSTTPWDDEKTAVPDDEREPPPIRFNALDLSQPAAISQNAEERITAIVDSDQVVRSEIVPLDDTGAEHALADAFDVDPEPSAEHEQPTRPTTRSIRPPLTNDGRLLTLEEAARMAADDLELPPVPKKALESTSIVRRRSKGDPITDLDVRTLLSEPSSPGIPVPSIEAANDAPEPTIPEMKSPMPAEPAKPAPRPRSARRKPSA
jgi:hypothetical protein